MPWHCTALQRARKDCPTGKLQIVSAIHAKWSCVPCHGLCVTVGGEGETEGGGGGGIEISCPSLSVRAPLCAN